MNDLKSQKNNNNQFQSIKRLQNDLLDEKLKELNDATCEINFNMVNGLLYIFMSPKIGPYRFKNFFFILDFRINYPYSPPKINAQSNTPHPNIDSKTQLFYLLLFEPFHWKPIYEYIFEKYKSLNDIIQAMKQTLIYVDFTYIPNNSTCLQMAQQILQQNQTLDQSDLELLHFEISENFKINFELNTNQVFEQENGIQKDKSKYSKLSQEPTTFNLLKTQRHGQNDRMICIKLKN